VRVLLTGLLACLLARSLARCLLATIDAVVRNVKPPRNDATMEKRRSRERGDGKSWPWCGRNSSLDEFGVILPVGSRL